MLTEQDNLIRFGCFAGILLLMALGEALSPRRHPPVRRPLRRFSNLGVVVLNSLVVQVLFPLGAVAIAVVAQDRGWGLFQNVTLPAWLAVVLSVVALDLVIYLQHVLFHAVPLFWRLHMVHHADLDFDVTTGLRFHTLEILLSRGLKIAAVALLGAPPLAVLVFQILLNATSMFNHSNVRLPGWLDRLLRFLIVTPDMHRVHHSAIVRETSSNFGFNLPWWDYLFGTYCAQPAEGHEGMTIGLSQFRDERVDWLHWLLLLPFVGPLGNYPVNRDGEDAGRGESCGQEGQESLVVADESRQLAVAQQPER